MSTVVILLDGNDITDDVVLSDAQFTQQANGQPGSCLFRIRDLDHVYGPTAGQTVTVDVDGVRVWGGWAMRVSPGYFFAVDDTSSANAVETERVWTIEGMDYNILFSKRFVLNKADPTKPFPMYPAGTPDKEMVLDLVSRFLELGGDGISTAGVTHVGTANPDDPGNVANPGSSWGQAMSIISMPTQAVFFIDPNKVLHFVDVETVSAPFALSDTPVGAEVGYRDMEINFDGTKLVNDAMVWGAGAHATPEITFKRARDQDSIDEHGRWQVGEFTTALYTNAGVNQRVQSYVYGSPQSKRGGKDDSVQVSCTIFEPGYTAGMIADFNSTVFDYTDVLPVRKMGIRFPTKTDVEFRLYLSYDIDAPWGDYEFWFPKSNYPPIDPPHFHWPPPVLPPPPPTEEGCDEQICGLTDTFSRVSTAWGWGTSDSGMTWVDDTTYLNLGIGNLSVDGSRARASYTFISGLTALRQTMFPWEGWGRGVVEQTFKLQYGGLVGTNYYVALYMEVLGDNGSQVMFFPTTPSGASTMRINLWGSTDPPSVPDNTFDFTQENWVRILTDSSAGAPTISVKVWPVGDPEPSAWTITGTDTNPSTPVSVVPPSFEWRQFGPGQANPVWYIDDLTLTVNGTTLTRCSNSQFDNFSRTVSGGWGTASDGEVWNTIGNTARVSVEDDAAKFTLLGTPSLEHVEQYVINSDASPWVNRIFTMTCRFKDDVIHVGGSDYILVGWGFGRVVPGGVDTTYFGAQINNGIGSVTIQHDPSFGDDAVDIPKNDWVANQWYLAKIELNPDVTAKIKIWPEGTTEPGWLLEMSDAWAPGEGGPLLPGDGFLYVDLWGRSSGELTIDYIDFDYDDRPCYPCDSGFENFDREEANSWGGFWEQNSNNPLGGSTRQASVAGGRGIITIDPATTGYVVLMTAHDPNLGWQQPGFTVTTVFRTGATIPVSGFHSFAIGDDFIGAGARIISGSGGDFSGYNGGAIAKTNWIANTDYVMEYEYTAGSPGTVSGRIYVLGNTPPDWDWTEDALGSPAGDFIVSYGLTGGQGIHTLSVESIDITYADSPCTSVVTCTPYEDWVSGADWTFVSGNISDLSFSGNHAILSGYSPESALLRKTIGSASSAFPDVAQPLTFSIPFTLTGPAAAQNSYVSASFTVDWTGGVNGGGNCTVRVSMSYSSIDAVFTSGLGIDYPISTGTGSAFEELEGRWLESGVITLSVGPGGYTASAGPLSVSTPGKYTSTSITTHPGMATTSVRFWVELNNRSGHNFGAVPTFETLSIGMIDIQGGWAPTSWCESSSSGPQYPTQGSSGSSTAGTRCDSFAGPGAMFTVAGPYQDQTTKVYIDGLLQRPGTDYYETDSHTGVVTLSDPAPPGSVVTICYTAFIGGG